MPSDVFRKLNYEGEGEIFVLNTSKTFELEIEYIDASTINKFYLSRMGSAQLPL